MSGFQLGVIILAAGASRRMGRPKLLLPWGGTTVLGHLLRLWNELEARQVGVVLAGNDAELVREVERRQPLAGRILNPVPERGMWSSVQCAARWEHWQSSLSHWAIVLGDQPHLRQDTLARLVAFAAGNPRRISQPSYAGRLRHPVILAREIFAELPGAGADNLREFLRRHEAEVAACPLEDSGLAMDMDTPADYTRALELFRARADGPASEKGVT